jgi:hypothetical protein
MSKHGHDSDKSQGLQGSRRENLSSQKENTSRHVYIEPGAQIDFVKSLREKYDADQKENVAHNKKQLFWTKVGAALILFYAGITLWQVVVTRSALKTSSQQFLLDQRPWLTPKDSPIIGGSVDANSHIVVHLEVENTGKSPAIHSMSHLEISANICPDAYPPPGGVHLVNDPGPVVYKTIFPGRSQGGDILNYPLDERTMERLNSGACGFYVAGKITYCDLTGFAHYQNWCWKWEKGRPLVWDVCTTYNDGDQDHPEVPPQPCER